MIECTGLTGRQVIPYLEDLAKLRCDAFREYPYLYDGDPTYEREYLANYAKSNDVFIVVAKAAGAVVGVSTCMPMAEAAPAFQAPFAIQGQSLDEICYFGESVLLKEFRGLGVGHRFFDLREQWAAARGFTVNTFCSVIRQDDHPNKPEAYRTHDRFWISRGYQRRDDLIAQLNWKEIADPSESESIHSLVFWLKRLQVQ